MNIFRRLKSRLQEQSPPARTDTEKLDIPLAAECETLQLKLDKQLNNTRCENDRREGD